MKRQNVSLMELMSEEAQDIELPRKDEHWLQGQRPL